LCGRTDTESACRISICSFGNEELGNFRVVSGYCRKERSFAVLVFRINISPFGNEIFDNGKEKQERCNLPDIPAIEELLPIEDCISEVLITPIHRIVPAGTAAVGAFLRQPATTAAA